MSLDLTKKTVAPLSTCQQNCNGGLACGKKATTTVNGKATTK